MANGDSNGEKWLIRSLVTMFGVISISFLGWLAVTTDVSARRLDTYQQIVQDLNANNTDLRGRIDDLSKRIDGLSERIRDLEYKVNGK